MLRLLPLLLLLTGCVRQVNPGAALPLYVGSAEDVAQMAPTLVAPAGATYHDQTGRLCVMLRDDLAPWQAHRVLAHELLAHACTGTDPLQVLRDLDPGDGSWLRHAPERAP
jgi:hypothetical protein